MQKKLFYLIILILFQTSPSLAKTYNLEIKKENIFITGKPVKSFTINNQLPGPTLYFKEGEDAVINVKNSSNESTSIHWHGILLPANMDGVPGLNGFHGIAPGKTFTYKFKIRQAGTYWYHSHSNVQEQEGLYGSIVIAPKNIEEKYNRDYVILLSDFTDENPHQILQNLKLDSGYYNYGKRTIFNFFSDIKKIGFKATLNDRIGWGQMRMEATDLADVSGYHFLVNGKTAKQNWTGIFKKNEKIRLRFINASAMSFYDVTIPGLKMKVIEADGRRVKPFMVDEFRIGIAEIYDVVVNPSEEKAYTIFAESLDRSGYARATLAPRENMEGEIPKMRPRTVLTMADMGHMNMDDDMAMNMETGWDNASTPKGHKALSYSDLISFYPQKDLRKPDKEIEMRLGGNMERYIWTINGKKFPAALHLKYGERVRLKFINETMMAHPMHLHGMFVQLENGQALENLPDKHTVIIPPGKTVSVLLTADEEGEWAFHCHLLYHMISGMMTSLTVSKE